MSSQATGAATLPVAREQSLALLARVPFGGALVKRSDAADSVSGHELMLCMPCWLDELLGNVLSPAIVEEIQLIEAHFLIYLQFLDDSIDGQSQIGPGDPRVTMAAAEAEGGFAAACSTLAGWFSDMLGEIADECHARTAADVLARLVNSLH